MAAGYAMQTKKIPLVYLQNSGIGNLLNPLVSLYGIYKFPCILLIGWRGHDQRDERQHNQQGMLTTSMLDLHSIPYRILDGEDTTKKTNELIDIAKNEHKIVCLLVPPDVIMNTERIESCNFDRRTCLIDPNELMKMIVCSLKNTNIVTSTGYNSRRCYTILKRLHTNVQAANKFMYCPGSMGHALSIGIGMSSHTSKRVVVIDGDGGFHMHSGTMTNIDLSNNLTHIILDNMCHESVGGQHTSGSNSTNIAHVLGAYAYQSVSTCSTLNELEHLLVKTALGRHAIICNTCRTNDELDRPLMDAFSICSTKRDWNKDP